MQDYKVEPNAFAGTQVIILMEMRQCLSVWLDVLGTDIGHVVETTLTMFMNYVSIIVLPADLSFLVFAPTVSMIA